MRNCFIHIGTHKTGTTSIQWLLSRNNSSLQTHGYFYPTAGRPEHMPGQHNLAWEISRDHRFRDHYGRIDNLLGEISTRSDDVILSSEDFECSLHHESRFSDFVVSLQSEGFLVTVILYVRSQIDYLPRIYLTLLLLNLELPFENVLRPILNTGEFRWRDWIFNFDYFDLLQRLRQHTNLNVIVRSYDRARTSVCNDLLSIFNLTLRDLHVDEEVLENASLPLRKYLGMFLQNRAGRKLTENEKQAVYELVPAGAGIDLSPGVQTSLYQKFRETNQQLFLRYGIPEPNISTKNISITPYVDEIFSEGAEASLLGLS